MNLVAAGAVARGWDSEFESALLQRRVCLCSEFQGCRQKAPRFRDALRVHGDVRRDVPGATRHHFALFL